MISLKKIIVSRLQWLSILMVVLILPIAAALQVFTLQTQAKENAQSSFHQIHQILEENTRDLERITEEYRQTCLLSAEAIAYTIQHHPEILGDIEEFRDLARIMEVDEIHLFDKTGCIFTGTHPEYYGFTFETGEQIGFFAPLLRDRSLRLCQDVTPNTAEGKLVQYSALWSEDGEFIVQVGMYPDALTQYTEKNELSYIFTLLQGAAGVELYAIDAQDGTILGSTSGSDNGKNLTELGLSLGNLVSYKHGASATVKGVNSFCVFTELDGMLIGYVVATDSLYHSMPLYTLLLATCMGLIVLMIVTLMWRYTRSYIIESIDRVNESLSVIADGNLDARVDVQSCLELSQLSAHINDMIRSLLATTDKMSFVLNHTNMRIGVYEYSTKMKTVRFTEHIPEILEWNPQLRAELSSDYHLLQQHFSKLLQNPVAGEKNTFLLQGKKETYIRMEEVVNGADTLGILIDVTEDILTRRRIERERDMDLLTGLYNRRGLEQQLAEVFRQEPGFGALVVIDSDDLKAINDRYGHTVGDRYIRCIAEAISGVGRCRQVAARLGGDEFVLLLHGYSSESAVLKDLEELRYVQNHTHLPLEDGSQIPVPFSFGYVMIQGRADYDKMLTEADSHMYNVKRARKRKRLEQTH